MSHDGLNSVMWDVQSNGWIDGIHTLVHNQMLLKITNVTDRLLVGNWIQSRGDETDRNRFLFEEQMGMLKVAG